MPAADVRRGPWRRVTGVGAQLPLRLLRSRPATAGQRRPTALGDVPGPVVAVAVAVCYVALAQYVIWLNDPVNAGAGYWPAAGLTLVAALMLPTRRWGWIAAAIAVGEIGGDAVHGYPLVASAWWAAGNIAEPLLAATILRRFGSGGRLAPLGHLVAFLAVGVVVGPFVGALIGSVGTSSEYDVSQLDVILKWWAGDGLGVLVVAPVLLCVRERAIRDRSRTELVALGLAAVAVPALAFRNWHPEWDVVLPYLIFPVVMWASVRFGIRGAALAGFVVAEMANFSTAIGYGPFHLAGGDDSHAVAVLQIFLGSALTAGLVVATLVHDALTRTTLYERQRSIADALQAAVLPQVLADAPGLSLAARYAPASDEAAVHIGGDWYDVFPLPGSATALVVGDVVGHDLGAAVMMGQLRNGLRSLLMERQDPAAVLTALDRQLTTAGDGWLATIVIGVYHDGVLRWANAGHPPLFNAPADGPARYLDDAPDPMIGVGMAYAEGGYRTHVLDMARGDLVVAYTDGLVEHRTWSLDDGMKRLARLVAQARERGPDAVCDLLLADGLAGRNRDDDTCVLVVRRDAEL